MDENSGMPNEDMNTQRPLESTQQLFYRCFKLLMDTDIIGIAIANTQGDILEANGYYLNMLGCTREELKEGKVRWIEMTPQEWLSADEKAIAQLRERGVCAPYEKEYVRKDGSRIPVFICNALLDSAKEYILALVLDIAERKKIEGELSESLKDANKARKVMISMLDDNNQIREELEKRLEELKQTQSMLVQSAKMASLGQLAGGVAHEINNPLTGVVNNIQLIKMDLETEKEIKLDDFKELLSVVEESALRCKRITESLLDFSHASGGIFETLDLNDIAKRVADLISHELKLENIIVRKDLCERIPMISGDPQLLQQVLMNLMVNACWAIQKKGDDTAAQGTITIRTWHESKEKSVYLLVSDSGIGIPKENLPRIFEPFFTTKDVGKGTGLGLALTYNIIQCHHGTVGVESRLGEGTIFTIKLPIAQSENG